MNRKTLTALKGSIKKWEKIVAGTGSDNGYQNCPLCALFVLDRRDPFARKELAFLKSLLPKARKAPVP